MRSDRVGISGLIAGGLLLLASGAAGESLWRESRTGFLFTDVRASRMGDIVTVLVMESSSSDRKAETNTKKESNNAFGVSNFFGNTNPLGGAGRNRTNFAFAGDNEQKANGNITRQDAVTAQIPARVVKILDTGQLLIEGRRAVVVNDETQTLGFSGIVRPEDITPENTVKSTMVADAEVTLIGKGVLAEKQRPGILNRLFDMFRIF
jgi:flagellar L-ring protein precursor FlgH